MYRICCTRPCYILTAIIFLCCNLDADAANGASYWPDLEAGPYSVGFTVKHEYDYSRSFRPEYDYFGNMAEEPIARPIQILIWYPAKFPAHPHYMEYSEYFTTSLTKSVFSDTAYQQFQEYIEQYKRILLMEWGTERKKMDSLAGVLGQLFEKSTSVIRDAEPAAGQFPLIIHMSGYNSSPNHHASLFEYLASHGFVVAGLPSIGMYAENIDNELLSIEVQARDMEFVYDYMRRLAYVDPQRVGTSGMSWGGMSNILFAQRNFNVDATVTLDGAITMPEELKLIEQIPGFDIKSFRSPYLQLLVTPAEAKFRPKDLKFYDGLLYADAYSIQFKGVVHDDFATDNIRIRNLVETDINKSQYRESFIRLLCEYTLNFFNFYLKHDESGRAYLQRMLNESEKRPDCIYSVEFKVGHKYPPTQEQFIEMVKSQGAQKAGEIYHEVKKVNPGAKLSLDSRFMGPLYMDAFQSGKYEEALNICKLWQLGNTDDVGPYFSMARIYRQIDKKNKAIECYQKILEIATEERHITAANNALYELQ